MIREVFILFCITVAAAMILLVFVSLYSITYGYSDAQKFGDGHFIGDYKYVLNGTLYKMGLPTNLPSIIAALLIISGLCALIGFVFLKERKQ